jgi:lysosomal Pro-X carboxypeptidase
LVVFAEHRYYGESLPYGNKSFADPRHLGYLTSQQALADYVDLIEYLKSKPSYNRSPVIAFGGSYGGMLSAWMRMKYPHIVQGYVLPLNNIVILFSYKCGEKNTRDNYFTTFLMVYNSNSF